MLFHVVAGCYLVLLLQFFSLIVGFRSAVLVVFLFLLFLGLFWPAAAATAAISLHIQRSVYPGNTSSTPPFRALSTDLTNLYFNRYLVVQGT